jgi:hypothetical protein
VPPPKPKISEDKLSQELSLLLDQCYPVSDECYPVSDDGDGGATWIIRSLADMLEKRTRKFPSFDKRWRWDRCVHALSLAADLADDADDVAPLKDAPR